MSRSDKIARTSSGKGDSSVVAPSFLPTTWHYFGVFKRYSGPRIYALLILPIFSSLLEGVGISVFLPILAAAEETTKQSRLGALVRQIFSMIGLQFSIQSALLLLTLVFVLKAVFEFWRQRSEILLTATISDKMRIEWLSRISRLDYLGFLSTNVGKLTNTVSFELVKLLNGLQTFTLLLATFVMVVGLLAINLWVDWRFTAIGLALGGLISVFQGTISKEVKGLSREGVRVNAEFQSLLIQSLYGFKYLTSTANFGPLRKHLESKAREGTEIGSRIALVLPFHQAVTQPALVITLCGLIYWQAVWNAKPIALVATSLLLFYRVTTFLLQLQGLWIRFCNTIGPTEEFFSSLDWMQERATSDRAVAELPEWNAIELKNLSFDYGERRILNEISLRIEKNSTVAFVGESGAGKTTMVDLVTGVLQPVEGDILLGGRSLSEIEPKSWRQRIGYIGQDSQIFNDTVFNNITLWSSDRNDPEALAKADQCARMAAVSEFIRSLPNGWDTVIGDRGSTISGGQRQRLAIARELFRSPDLLILDEATSALDSETENTVREAIDSLAGRMTIIVIAHRISTVMKADKIFVLKNGSLERQGTFPQLFSEEGSVFRRMCERQNLSV